MVERDGAGAVTHEYSWTYDHNDKVTSLTESVNGRSLHYVYAYNADQVAEGMSGDVGRSFTYDGLGRTAAVTTNGLLTTAYTYRTVSDNGTDYATAQIAALHNSYAGGSRNYSYTYDANGNILAVSDGTSTTGYTYDAQGQLVREDNQAAGKTWVYSYDNGGNILSRSEYAYTTGEPGTPTDTVSYTYGDADWGDLLTAYDGQPISYDGIGNMTAFEGWSFLWQGGRQLAGMSNGGTALSFAYNDDGCRVEKTVNGVTHQYIYRGEQLIADVCGNDALYFRYDQNGDVLGFKRYLGEAYGEYTYVKNQQGDIMAVLDCEGSEAATYTYDAWGNILTTGGYDADVTARNPLRYRGYYYDSETGLYYVSSRYYDPEIGRWINADGEMSDVGGDILGYNLFAYCMNNPVNMSDPSGNWPKWATKLVAAVAVVAVVAVVAAVTVATAGAGTAIAAVAVGAAKGAAIGFAVGAATGAAGGAISHRISTGSWSGAGEAALNGMADGALSGSITGSITGGIKGGMSYTPKTTTSPVSSNTTNTPSIKYPGNDPAKCNIPDFEWRGSGTPASGRGNFVNMKTGEWLHPDLNHGPPIGPHWDYGVRGSSQTFRIFPDGNILPK